MADLLLILRSVQAMIKPFFILDIIYIPWVCYQTYFVHQQGYSYVYLNFKNAHIFKYTLQYGWSIAVWDWNIDNFQFLFWFSYSEEKNVILSFLLFCYPDINQLDDIENPSKQLYD